MKDIALETIGKWYVPSEAKRDAVHIAVAPVKPVEDMEPGTRVVFVDDGDTVRVKRAGNAPAIGIIDPFLTAKAMKDWTVWMLLMPRSITGLRHEWSHPAFVQSNADDSEEWLRAGCEQYHMDYEELIEGATRGTGGCFGHDDGPEWTRTYEFWKHLEAVTGRKFTDEHKEETYFRCAC